MAFRFTLPRCQCRHVDGLGEESTCEERAAFRVTVVCLVEGCSCGATVYLLCGECTDVWQERAARDPQAPELRVTPF